MIVDTRNQLFQLVQINFLLLLFPLHYSLLFRSLSRFLNAILRLISTTAFLRFCFDGYFLFPVWNIASTCLCCCCFTVETLEWWILRVSGIATRPTTLALASWKQGFHAQSIRAYPRSERLCKEHPIKSVWRFNERWTGRWIAHWRNARS